MQRRDTYRKKPKGRRRNPRNGKALLWLFLCYPVGLTKMWKSSCTWKLGVKYAVSSLAFIIVGVALFYPSPQQETIGGVTLYGEEPVAKIYGPELPESMVYGYSQTVVSSVLAPEATDAASVQRVYAAEGADCYHLEKCKYAYASANYLTIYEAYLLGYEPCGLCNPPAYTG